MRTGEITMCWAPYDEEFHRWGILWERMYTRIRGVSRCETMVFAPHEEQQDDLVVSFPASGKTLRFSMNLSESLGEWRGIGGFGCTPDAATIRATHLRWRAAVDEPVLAALDRRGFWQG